jgi:glycosyltransferase involved in cell wall biosynthesis
MDQNIPLSVATIMKDEAANLPDCLKSISFAKQIVVVDSRSRDGPLEIAEKFGCEVFSDSRKGFRPQKQVAIDRCRKP